MIGSLDSVTLRALKPSASETTRRYRRDGGVPSTETYAIRVENAPGMPVSRSKTRSAILWAAARMLWPGTGTVSASSASPVWTLKSSKTTDVKPRSVTTRPTTM